MTAHRLAAAALQGLRALMSLAFVVSCIDSAQADIPMLTRHVSFDGEHAVHTRAGGAEPLAGALLARRDEGGPTLTGDAREGLFTDGFQPSAL